MGIDQRCEELGLEQYYIHKNLPNENAVIERSFRTAKDGFFYWMRDLAEGGGLYAAECLEICNSIRPHMGLDMLTPKEAVALYHK